MEPSRICRSMMRLLLYVIAFLGSLISVAQTVPIGVIPMMKVNNLHSQESPMSLDVLKIDIKVIGNIAVTTLEMTFFNNNDRVMEGEFSFPLAQGQNISRFALDINGSLREGVVVEKQKGREAFEAVVRKGVDPGLLEKTEGNNFKARVYPLPSHGSRKVLISIEQELSDKGKNDLYLLPLNISESVKKFSVHAEVVKNTVSFDTEQNEFNALTFNKWNDSYVADFEKENFTPDKKIALLFPHIRDDVRVFTATKTGTDSSYFYLNFRPEMHERAKVLPQKITILWDNSNSAQNRNIDKELSVLDTYLKSIGNVTVELVPFSIKAERAREFVVKNGDCSALKVAIKSLFNDGGTSFGAIQFPSFKSDEILLFSDGLSNYRSTEPLFGTVPVYTINSALSANHSFLTYIAQRSGGTYLNLSRLTNAEAQYQLSNLNYHFISAQPEFCSGKNIFPSMPCTFDKTFSMSGIMSGKVMSLVLNFGFGTNVVYTKRVTINADNSADESLLKRFWAERKIDELSLDEEKNKDEITNLGKQYNIVTNNTSLIVLENLNDYLEHGIVPPVELQNEYYKALAVQSNSQKEEEKNHIDEVIRLSEEQTKWWTTNYPLPVKPNTLKKSSVSGSRFAVPSVNSHVSAEYDMVNEEMAAPPPPPALGESNADVQEMAEEVKAEEPHRMSSIQLNAWDPQTPYYKVLQYAVAGQEYATYIKLKQEYGTTPSFYVDASDYFAKLGKVDTAVKILSNLAELKLESVQLLRVLGKKLLVLKQYSEAEDVFQKVVKLKGEEPQSYRDLGEAYNAHGKYQQAIETLYEIVKQRWDSRFPSIELIVMNEINAIIAAHPDLKVSFINKQLLKKEPVDIRVVLTWDTDNCDMDLWVTDPDGEKCFYQNKLTRLGGKISNDFTGGYGPEEFMIKKAVDGAYKVEANYYGTRAQNLLAPVSLHLTFITDFGKPTQKEDEVVLRLETQKDVINVGTFQFKTNVKK